MMSGRQRHSNRDVRSFSTALAPDHDLVACLGLLPAALSTGIGSSTQKPFAIVIVAGLVSRLFLGFFVNPVLYLMVAKDGDVLQV
jgi:cobalt-zinc-cadmium resistance protein CzcA